jgi:glycosyltransferase involved in cell wall biosynthesis
MDNPVVTVICITYNHAPYIRDALEGFVGQQTDFPVEIIVHDDASTDGTADVVREYAARYPDRVRPVIQTENQYSRGVAILPVYCFPLVRGRYVALCEGDDHWTDPTKLQRQVEALERHPEMDFCAHCTRRTRDGRTIGFVAPRLKDGVIPAEEVVKVIPLATASLLIRKTCYLTLTPMREIRFNDMALQLQALARGGVMYLSRCMAEYRSQTPGSWTAAHRGKMALEDRRVDRMQLEAFDAWTDGKFHGAVRWRLAKIETGNIISCHRYWELFAPRWILWTFRRLGYTLRRRFNSLVCRLRWKTG